MSPELQEPSSQVKDNKQKSDYSSGPENLPWQMEFILQPGLQESDRALQSPQDETFEGWVKSRSTTMKLLLSRLARKELLPLTSQELRNRLILTRLPLDRGVSTAGLFIHGLQAYPEDLGSIIKELEHDWRN
jgi:hypothetical protein